MEAIPPQALGVKGLCPVDDVTEDLVGKWCVITYDEDPYPGIIENIGDLYIFSFPFNI